MTDFPAPAPARTPTQEEIDADRAWAIQADADLKNAIRLTRSDLWDVAKALHEWDLRRGWLKTSNYESLGEWLADPEVAMTRGTYYRLRDGYRTLVVDRRVPEATVKTLDTSKVGVVLKAVRDHEVDVEDAIADVETLSKSDLISKYKPPPTVNGINGSPPVDTSAPTDDVFDGEVLDGDALEPVEVRVDLASDPEQVIDATLPDEDVELEPLEWAVSALRAIVGPVEGQPWVQAFDEAGGGTEGLRAIAETALEAM